jgi:cytochrome P450
LTAQFHPDATQCPVRGYTPQPQQPLPIYGPAFDVDPQSTYRQLRDRGPVVPVEMSPGVFGYLAVTYRACLYLLRNTPALFHKDPTHNWQALRTGQIPANSPARQMMMPRDNALWKDGAEHQRLRGAITGALARIDTYALADSVARIADNLIDAFLPAGQADLVAQYADPLPTLTIIELFGCPPEHGQRIIRYVSRLLVVEDDAAQANVMLEAACLELVQLKRAQPGRDIVSYLIQVGLSDGELVQTLLLLFGAAAPPAAKHIARGLQRFLSSERFAGSVYIGVTPVAAALEEVLWDEPPLPNYSPLYAQGPQQVEGVTVHPGFPVLVSFAAANSDPAVAVDADQRTGNRGHLAFSAGVHACPAPGLARIISETAVERLLDRLPTLTVAVPVSDLANLPGTFLAGPASLPVRFQPAAIHTGT